MGQNGEEVKGLILEAHKFNNGGVVSGSVDVVTGDGSGACNCDLLDEKELNLMVCSNESSMIQAVGLTTAAVVKKYNTDSGNVVNVAHATKHHNGPAHTVLTRRVAFNIDSRENEAYCVTMNPAGKGAVTDQEHHQYTCHATNN